MKRLLLLLLPALAPAVFDVQTYDLNNWRSAFSNYGTWGYNNQQAAGFWRDSAYIYGAGIWIGRMNGNDTLVTVGYNPNSGRSEMFPTLTQYWREGSADPRDRIYKYPGDWPAPPDRFPMAPTTPLSDIEAWSCCCDSDPTKHTAPGRPIGFDLYQTVYAFTDSANLDFFILRYDIVNKSGSALSNVCVGMAIDADVGNAADDMCGLILDRLFQVGPDTIRVQNTGFCYSMDNNPSGAVAVKLLSAPSGLGMTAFKLFTLTESDPVNDFQQYLALSGYNWTPPYEYAPYDSIDPAPADKRYLLSTGPFDLQPDSNATFYYAVIGAPFEPNDTTGIAIRSRLADAAFERLLGIAEPGPAPAAGRFHVGPNPCSPSAPLQVRARAGEDLAVTVYDAAGLKVATVTGTGSVRWRGGNAPQGAYLVQVSSGRGTETHKVLYLKD